ncbi:GNAT family N-acetyltransferase [Chloroflexota bacterium]
MDDAQGAESDLAMEISNIIPLQKDQIVPAAEMLARAFEDDPLFKSLIPDDEKRRKKATHLFTFTLKLGIRYGEVYTTSQNLEAITVWMRPDEDNINLWKALRCGVIPLIFRVGPRLMKKMNAVDGYGERVRKRLAPSRYWYLAILGVDPDHQGKGHASELMKPMLKRIDGEGLPCYLETDTEKNISMYQHFGFKLLEHIDVTEYNTQFDAMLKEPAAT